MSPDVDDLVVTLAVGDDAFAVLLLNLTDLFVGIFQLGLFLFWNDHIRNSNRNAGLGRLRKTEFFQLVQRRNCFCWSCDLVTTPDDVAQLFFRCRLVEESKLLGPNLVKHHASSRGLDGLRSGVSINRLPSQIGVLKS